MSEEVKERASMKVRNIPRLCNDIVAINMLLAGEIHYRIPVRFKQNGWVEYGMGDASGDGFEATFYIGGVLLFRYG